MFLIDKRKTTIAYAEYKRGNLCYVMDKVGKIYDVDLSYAYDKTRLL